MSDTKKSKKQNKRKETAEKTITLPSAPKKADEEETSAKHTDKKQKSDTEEEEPKISWMVFIWHNEGMSPPVVQLKVLAANEEEADNAGWQYILRSEDATDSESDSPMTIERLKEKRSEDYSIESLPWSTFVVRASSADGWAYYI